MGSRGATPGKRLMGLRVVARDGARLTGAAVIARNAMREIEVFLPLSFLGQQTAEGTADTFLVLFALTLERHFPVLSAVQPRPAAGRRSGRRHLGGSHRQAEARRGSGRKRDQRQRRTFPEAALDLYGIYELQTLEEVLRNEQPDAVVTVARTIRAKARAARRRRRLRLPVGLLCRAVRPARGRADGRPPAREQIRKLAGRQGLGFNGRRSRRDACRDGA